MSYPPEFPQIIQFIVSLITEHVRLFLILASFVVGSIVGSVVKSPRSVAELTVIVLVLVFILKIAGYTNPALDVYDEAVSFLHKLIDLGGGLNTVLIYSLPSFLIGLVLGLWKG